MRRVRYFLLALLVAILAALAGGYYWLHSGTRTHYARLSCSSAYPSATAAKPVAVREVNPKGGYVLFKDRNGPLQYLLMPTYRINGTRKPAAAGSVDAELFLAGLAGA